MIMTASYDKNVHLIRYDNDNKEILGTLKQGYKTLAKYKWDLSFETFLSAHPEKMLRLERDIKKLYEERMEKLS